MWLYDYNAPQNNPYRESPFAAVTHMGYIDTLPRLSYRWHAHETDYEIAFVTEGEGELIVERQHMKLGTGAIALLPPRVMHYFSCGPQDGMRYFVLRFSPEPSSGELQTFFRAQGIAVTSGINFLPYIQQTMRLLFDLHNVTHGVVDGTFQSLALGLLQLVRLLFTHKALCIRTESNCSAGRILQYLAEAGQGGEKITLDTLAKRFNVSPSHLSRIFSSAYHISPISYLIHLRILNAADLLLKTEDSIEHIAKQVGYDNPVHFTRMFTKHIGCSPTEYRARNPEYTRRYAGDDYN